MLKNILALIEQFDTITIFRHEMPDSDALGSQCGLASWLKSIYPQKRVYCLGKNDGSDKDLFSPMDIVEDETIVKSLAIIVDSATRNRIDDQRFLNAQKIVKIDHHIAVDDFGDLEYVDPKKSSCCEIIAELIGLLQPIESLDAKSAAYLYMGILTDTNQFTTTNTNFATLQTASKLAATGLDISDLNYQLFKQDQNVFRLASRMRTEIIYDHETCLAYVYLTKAHMEEFRVPYNQAKNLVNEFNRIADLMAWVLFVEDEMSKDVLFNASIRSRKPIVNDIAAQFGGGGHQHAAGAKGLSSEKTKDLIERLKIRIKETK